MARDMYSYGNDRLKNWAFFGGAILVIGAGWAYLADGFSFSHSVTADRGQNAQITQKGRLAAINLLVGDCFQDPAANGDVIADVTAMPCTQSHTAQVIGYFDYDLEYPLTDKPSATAIRQRLMTAARDKCPDPFSTPAIDASRFPAGATASVYYPETALRLPGDIQVLCSVVADQGWTGSVMK